MYNRVYSIRDVQGPGELIRKFFSIIGQNNYFGHSFVGFLDKKPKKIEEVSGALAVSNHIIKYQLHVIISYPLYVIQKINPF